MRLEIGSGFLRLGSEERIGEDWFQGQRWDG